MQICVINGSPRGKYSTTLHTLLYLEKRFPQHTFAFAHIGPGIHALEADITSVAASMQAADLIVFAYPVYTFLAPSQLHRFIAALKAQKVSMAGKFVTQVTTSKHFYDTTAHRYVEDNCHDMGMKVIHGLSADMDDLLSPKGREDADRFFQYCLWCVEHGIYEPVPTQNALEWVYVPGLPVVDKTSAFDVVIVADLREGDAALSAMVKDFRKACSFPTRLVNLAAYPFKGGCLGCFHCAGDGKCVYKDGFDAFLRNEIQQADAIVYAFTIRDHSMGTTFKVYDDRQFCNGHRTVTEGMPFAYIVNGNYEAEANLRTVVEARCEVGGNFLAGVGYDAESLSSVARRLAYALQHHYKQPRNFYGVGGMKIFRDLIWLMRGIMKADHLFYKAHGVYDFPQKQWGKMVKMCLLGALVRNPKVKAKLGNRMNEGMVAPYNKVLKETKPLE